MLAVTFCCHVRKDMRGRHAMMAAFICMGCVLGRKPKHETECFSV